jgi:hypothetical protein
VTRQSSTTTDFVSPLAALEHVAAHEGAPAALAQRLLVQALAKGLRARGYVIYSWPPYREGYEQLSPELFTDYGPQHSPARIDCAAATAVMLDGHPHPACTVHGLEVSKAGLLARWPGRLKRPAKSQRPSIQAEATTPDGLITKAEAAAKLGCSIKTLKGYVHAGALKYVALGHGKRRQRRMFTEADLNEFIATQSRKDVPCPSIRTGTAARRTGISTSRSEVIGFMDRRNARRGVKPKQ